MEAAGVKLGDKSVENFQGVYLLYSTNPRYKGRVYIGYTVDPQRRLRQHNGGRQAGGAVRTSSRGPWLMALVVHGFPSSIAALRFEWALQHPRKSRRLRHLAVKRPRELQYDYRVRVLAAMLRLGPWCRLPLAVRWLQSDLWRRLDSTPPRHMPMLHGAVRSVRVAPPTAAADDAAAAAAGDAAACCAVCRCAVSADDLLHCVDPGCAMTAHLVCLAELFVRGSKQLLPADGPCPVCKLSLLWGDLIKKRNGCFQNLNDDFRARD